MTKKLTVTATVRRDYSANLPDGFPVGTRSYKVTLSHCGRKLTVPFHQGPGIKRDPTADDVMECLLSDASTIENAGGFEEWASELGFDTDSRTAEHTYLQCKRQTEKLRALLGDDYDAMLYADRQEAS